MGVIGSYIKAASERKRYQADYTDWLDTGEGVQTVVFGVLNNTTSNPLVVDGNMVLPTALGVQYYVSGGVDNVQYSIGLTMTTTQGQIKFDEVLITIREPR